MSGCHDPSMNYRHERDIIARLDKLEESYHGLFHEYNHLEDAIVELRQKSFKKKPHKCPICNGSGAGEKYADVVIDGITIGNRHHNCTACTGEGIVWG